MSLFNVDEIFDVYRRNKKNKKKLSAYLHIQMLFMEIIFHNIWLPVVMKWYFVFGFFSYVSFRKCFLIKLPQTSSLRPQKRCGRNCKWKFGLCNSLNALMDLNFSQRFIFLNQVSMLLVSEINTEDVIQSERICCWLRSSGRSKIYILINFRRVMFQLFLWSWYRINQHSNFRRQIP